TAEEPSVTDSEIVGRIIDNPACFDFFQAVRILRQELDQATRPNVHPTHGASSLNDDRMNDPIQFRSTISAGFPFGAITDVKVHQGGVEDERKEHKHGDENSSAIDVDISHFGLIGPNGKLPRHYTDLIIERFRKFRDRTLHRFVDIFVNHFTKLLYKSWAKYRPAIEYEGGRSKPRRQSHRVVSGKESDALTHTIAALVGLGTAGLSDRLDVPDDALFYHCSSLIGQTRPVESVQRIARDVFQLPLEIEPFIGRWLELEPPDRTRLANANQWNGQHAQLGVDAIAGSRVWDVASTFEVRAGPLSANDFRTLLPGQQRSRALGSLLRFTVGLQHSIRLRLILSGNEVPPCRLAMTNAKKYLEPRLGWSMWLPTTKTTSMDRADASFEIGT
ncbi:MAG: type VI secretion system baseplate subunit TssG, partial [Pirellulales bacterium]